MKKRYIVCLTALSSLLVIGFVWWFLFAPSYLRFAPKGEYISQSTSPNGDYIVKIYRSSGGATTPFAIRGEVTYTNKVFNKKTGHLLPCFLLETLIILWLFHN